MQVTEQRDWERATRAHKYEIWFMEDQVHIIEELFEIWDEYVEDKDHLTNDEEDDEYIDLYDLDKLSKDSKGDQKGSEDNDLSVEGAFDDEDDTDVEFLTHVAENLMHLSIAFITQYFLGGNDHRSPLTYFADVIGMHNKLHRFQEPHNYMAYVDALL